MTALSAEAYRGLEIASAAVLPQLEAGEYYWRDLQGLQVWCQDGDADDRMT